MITRSLATVAKTTAAEQYVLTILYIIKLFFILKLLNIFSVYSATFVI